MASYIKALKPFASSDIGDALIRLKYPQGGFLSGINMWSPTRQGYGANTSTIGEVTTVKMVSANDTTSPSPPKHFIDNNQAGKIMYIKQPQHAFTACFGGLMATRAKYLGAAGVIIDGRFRDVQEIQEMGLPVFARGTSILGSNTFTRASEIDVPIKAYGDLWINPGDLIVGDHDGCVVVPPSLVDQVAALCAERKEIDEKMMTALHDGEEMGVAIAKFKK